MLRKLFFCFILLFPNTSFSQNIIDKLITDDEVLTFIRRLKPEFKDIFIYPPKQPFSLEVGIKDYKERIKKFGGQSFAKADFDNNGQTDLLFNGFIDDNEKSSFCNFFSFVVMSFGNDSFQIKELTRGNLVRFFTSKVVAVEKKSAIVVLRNKNKYEVQLNRPTIIPIRTDTLIYLFEDFIEKSNQHNHNITGINFLSLSGGFGFLPSFRLIINADSMKLESGQSLSNENTDIDHPGTFISKTDTSLYKKIIAILNYENFPNFNNEYSVSWSDAVEGFTTIFYDNKKIKKIHDYGLIGTYGLSVVQDIFFKLRKTVNWKKISSESSIL